MNKRIIIAVLLSVMVIGVGEFIKGYNRNGSEQLIEAFSDTSFRLNESDLNIWGEYKPKYMTKEEMITIVTQLATNLGIYDYQEQYLEDESNKTYVIEKKATNATTQIKMIEVIEQVEKDTYKAQNYLVVNIVLKDKCDSILHFEDIISSYYEEVNVEPVTSLTITGNVEGKISEFAAKEVMTSIIQGLNGEVIASYNTEERKSVYGYSKWLDDYIISNGEKINMDLAMTYNEIENKTYLYGAIPIITIEY